MILEVPLRTFWFKLNLLLPQVQLGDFVMAVDGVSAEGLDVAELIRRIKGDPGSKVGRRWW